jgi:hypothetical protein
VSSPPFGPQGQDQPPDLALPLLKEVHPLSLEEESRLRTRIIREVAADVATIIARIEPAEVDGNVHLPKPVLVSALSRYFADAGVDNEAFVARCYSQ